MDNALTKQMVCCADHDHATDPTCEVGAAFAVVPLTDEEIAEREAAAKSIAEANKLEAEAKAAREALRESAKIKLVAGQPLTEEEAATIVL